jgi:predicted lipase
MRHIIAKGEVAFLHDHVAQLTQSISQLSLKLGEEVIEKRMVAILEMIRLCDRDIGF